MGCNLCAATRDPLLVEAGPEAFVLADRAPMCAGHLLVVAGEHVASTADLGPSAQAAFQEALSRATDLASAIAGRSALAVEHGRSPTCGDASCSCHAHVHVLPLGELDSRMLDDSDWLVPRRGAGPDSYLSIKGQAEGWRHFDLSRPIPHAARTIAARVAEANRVRWRPLIATPDHEMARSTLREARRRQRYGASPAPSNLRRLLRPEAGRPAPPRPIVIVSGSTGSGKSTTARHLARELGVPAIELGVILRVLASSVRGQTHRRAPDVLWRWSRQDRLDFDGASSHGLAAAVPRLDGAGQELPLWTDIEASRLTDLAGREDVQEILVAIADRMAADSGAVIVGRVPPALEIRGARPLRLDARGEIRAARKRRQLARIGMSPDEHDWFNPRVGRRREEPIAVGAIDTGAVGIAQMCAAALESLDDEDRRLRAS